MGPTASGGLAPGRRELTSPAALAQSPKKKVTRIDLQTLKGIGKDDLVSRNGIPEATYSKIKDHIIARQPAAKK